MQYKIKKGDTLSAISKKLGISVADLAKANNIKDVNKIYAGANLIIPQPKKKKSSSVERVIPQEKKSKRQKDIETAQLKANRSQPKPSKPKKKKEPILPINVRQFLNPNQDRTEEDLSTEEKKALKEVIARSQTPERIAEKKSQGLDPNLIEYKDYATTSEGSQYADVDRTSDMSVGDLVNKIQNPNYNLKTFLGQATAIPQEGGGYRVVDTFDFKPATQATGLKKVKQYLSSIDDAGFNPYAQLRNFMGYYGPQEGTGQGGRSNINLSAQGGQTRYNFNKGGSMNIQEQTKNVAAQGRYGDSMLLHVNPAEVKGLAQAMPITINPETGQPEAFLPFLAPIAGSLIGSGLAGGAAASALGLGGLSSLAMGALGSGVAQYAVTGDLKKGILAGLTGYGVGSALQGAGAAAGAADATTAATQTATDAATKAAMTDPNLITSTASNVGPVAPVLNPAGDLAVQQAVAGAQPGIAQAGQTAATDYLANTARTGIEAGRDAFAGNTFGEGVGNVIQGLSQPSAYIPAGIGMGGTSIMESQELFAQQEADRLRRYNEDREEMYRNAPEPILYSANGGVTNFRGGGRSEDDGYTGGNLPQIYAPDRAAYDVNPNFMAGFQPETMYFNPATVSAPASNLTTNRPFGGIDTYEGSKGGYGGMEASIAPQVSIDPFAAYTGQAPAGLQFTAPTPPAPPEAPPITPPITPPIVPPIDFPIDFPINIPGIGGGFGGFGNLDFSGLADLDFSNFDFSQFNPNLKEEIDTGIGQDFMIKPPVDVPVDYTIPDGRNFSIQKPSEMVFIGGDGQFIGSAGVTPPAPILGGNDFLSKPPGIGKPMDDFMSIERIPDESAGAVPSQKDILDTYTPYLLGSTKPEITLSNIKALEDAGYALEGALPTSDAKIDPTTFRGGKDSGGSFVPKVPQPPAPVVPQPMPATLPIKDDFIQGGFMPQPVLPQLELPTTPVSIPAITSPVVPQMPVDLGMIPAPSVNLPLPQTRMEMEKAMLRGRAEGGDTLKDIPADNKGLPNLPESVRNEMGFKQAGGETEVDPLITEVTAFILGESDNNEALNAFIQKYGNEAFMQLRQQILQSLVPNAQTEGQIQGDGNGGMDDDLFGRIGNKERIAVSQDEFIVPADVVSMLGDGSSDAGSKELYDMMDRVRKEKTGTTKQAPRLANAGGLLPA